MSKPVIVNVEIEATPPARVVVTLGDPKPERLRREVSRLLSFTLPRQGDQNTPVRVDPNTNLGYICAKGSEDSFMAGRQIKGMVYPGQTPTIDVNPPASAILGTVDNLGNWVFSGANDLPGCAFGNAGPGAYNTLVIWYLDTNSSVIERKSVVFQGIRSAMTQCSGSGSGSPSGTPSGSGSSPGMLGSAEATTLYLSGDDGSSATLTKQPAGTNLWVGSTAGVRYRLNGPVSGKGWDQSCTLVVSDCKSGVGCAETIQPDPLEVTFVVTGVTYTIIP